MSRRTGIYGWVQTGYAVLDTRRLHVAPIPEGVTEEALLAAIDDIELEETRERNRLSPEDRRKKQEAQDYVDRHHRFGGL